METKWVPLYDFEGYLVSNTGIIKSVDRIVEDKRGILYRRKGKIIKPRRSKVNPHLFITIHWRGTGKKATIYLHRAVADHFLPNPYKGIVYAHHKDGNYDNNHVNNLMWIKSTELVHYQPKRLADPKKGWRTRREKYKNSWGSAQEPKWNTKKQWETKYSRYQYKKSKKTS